MGLMSFNTGCLNVGSASRLRKWLSLPKSYSISPDKFWRNVCDYITSGFRTPSFEGISSEAAAARQAFVLLILVEATFEDPLYCDHPKLQKCLVTY